MLLVNGNLIYCLISPRYGFSGWQLISFAVADSKSKFLHSLFGFSLFFLFPLPVLGYEGWVSVCVCVCGWWGGVVKSVN